MSKTYKYNGDEYLLLPIDINATDNPIDIVKVGVVFDSSTSYRLGVEGIGWRLVGLAESSANGAEIVSVVFQCCKTHPDLMGVIKTNHGGEL